jgi:16S rRNA (uracil1498-N3)-methyltransferase
LTSNRFSLKQSDIRSSSVFLDGEEHHHLSRVARIKPGEKVWLFDEHGTNYLARVEEISKKRTRLAILERQVTPVPKVKITLAQALIKSKKMNSIIQKATELGVTTIIPVLTARTVVRIEERAKKKLERWQKIIHAAAKQSKIHFLPSISFPVTLKKLVEERDEAKKLVLSENRGKYLKDILVQGTGLEREREELPSSVVILVGPEGGWTSEEEEYILGHGYEAVSLGRQVLRTETASLSSLAMISHFWNS